MYIKGAKLNGVIYLPLVFFLLISDYVSAEINLILVLLALIYYFVTYRKLEINMPGIGMYILMFCMGFIGVIANQGPNGQSIYIVLKQCYYYIFPLLYWIMGWYFIKKENLSRREIVLTIIFAGTIYSIIDLCTSAVSLLTSNVNISSSDSIRSITGVGHILPVVGLIMAIIYWKEFSISRRCYISVLILCFLSFLIHFSRSYIVMAVILLFFSGALRNFKRSIKIFVAIVCVIGLLIAIFPAQFDWLLQKLLDSFNEISYNVDVWDGTTITQNWRGYEIYCAIEQFNSSPILIKLFGGGFGTFIDVHGYEFLVTSEEGLSFLHNGYFTQLSLFGIFGLVLLILFFCKIFMCAKNLQAQGDKRIIRGLAVCIFFANYVIMGPLFSISVAQYFLLISVIYNASKAEDWHQNFAPILEKNYLVVNSI